MKTNFNDMTRRFLMSEGKDENIMTYIQSIMETLDNLTPRTKTDFYRLDVAKKHIREIRKASRRLNERINKLEEQVKVLEEGSD